jgi:hypothetical protein
VACDADLLRAAPVLLPEGERTAEVFRDAVEGLEIFFDCFFPPAPPREGVRATVRTAVLGFDAPVFLAPVFEDDGLEAVFFEGVLFFEAEAPDFLEDEALRVDLPAVPLLFFFLDDFEDTAGFFLVEVAFPFLFFPPMRPFSLHLN